jgi:hypothetical protein
MLNRPRDPRHRFFAPEFQVLRVSGRQELNLLMTSFTSLDGHSPGVSSPRPIDCKLRRLVAASAHFPSGEALLPAACDMLVSPSPVNFSTLHHHRLLDNNQQASPYPPPQAYLIPATMNASPTKTTITPPYPGFLEGFPNATVPYCALPSCANSTAIMAQCCACSPVFPYRSARGPDPSLNNITDLAALWCHVDNSSTSVWLDCVGEANSPMGLCSDLSSSVKGRASRDATVGLKTIV